MLLVVADECVAVNDVLVVVGDDASCDDVGSW